MADAAAVLDGYDVRAAHIVGMSMGGGLAQLLALDFPDRALSLSTSPVLPGDRDLPGSDASLRRVLASAEVDRSDEASLLLDWGVVSDAILDHSRRGVEP